MKQQRPVNLDLTTFKFPPTSIVSILHRGSGFILFLVIPIILRALELSLESVQGYASITAWADSLLCRFILGAAAGALFYHVVAGLRHLVMDMGFCETLETGTLSAKIALGLGLGGAVLIFLMILF